MSTRIITPKAILSYPQLIEPVVDDNGVAKYSCALIFPKGSDLTALKKAAVAILVEKFGVKATKEGIRDGTFRLPFRDDWEKKGYPEGSTFFNCKTKQKPGCVSQVPGKDGKPKRYTDEEIVEEMYAGCFVVASVGPFYYNRKGNKGVGFGLNNLQKVGDGEPLGNRVAAEEEFSADPDAAAKLEDLEDIVEVDENGEEVLPEEEDADEIDLSDLLE